MQEGKLNSMATVAQYEVRKVIYPHTLCDEIRSGLVPSVVGSGSPRQGMGLRTSYDLVGATTQAAVPPRAQDSDCSRDLTLAG